jgi:hypothetical protein
VQDLNLNPKLPFEDNSFDVITNAVSVLSTSLDHFGCALFDWFMFSQNILLQIAI